jgi:hypothetical protein
MSTPSAPDYAVKQRVASEMPCGTIFSLNLQSKSAARGPSKLRKRVSRGNTSRRDRTQDDRESRSERSSTMSSLRMHPGFQRKLDELSDGFWTAWNRALL